MDAEASDGLPSARAGTGRAMFRALLVRGFGGSVKILFFGGRMVNRFIVLFHLLCSLALAGPQNMDDLDRLIAMMISDLAGARNSISIDSAEGAIGFLTPEQCELLDSCFGNNPSSPYGAIAFPKAPGQPAAPKLKTNLPTFLGMDIFTQLREDEAVVILGWTPSGVTYFGFTPYLMSRLMKGDREQSTIFGAVGDTLNHKVIGTESVDGSTSGKFTAIILSSDQRITSRVRSELTRLGIASAAINQLIYPKSFPLQLGWKPGADTIGALLRLGLPIDKNLSQAYLSAPPLRVIRLTPRVPLPSIAIAQPPLRKIGTGLCESAPTSSNGLSGCAQIIDSQLGGALETAANEIQKRWGLYRTGPATPAFSAPESTVSSTQGAGCAQEGKNCNGDNRDVIYGLDTLPIRLEQNPDDYVVIIGANHTKLGKALYFNHSVYRVSDFSGVSSFSNLDIEKNGQMSIEYYLGRPVKNSSENLLYAFKISRYCHSQPFCLEISSSGSLGIPVDSSLLVTSRIYLEPATNVKPSEREILLHRVLRSRP